MQGKKITTCFAIVLFSLTAVACSSADKTYQNYKDLEFIALQGEAVYKKYKTADYSTAKSALLTYIEDLEKLVQTNHPEQFAFQVDIFVSYVRLAKLEEVKNGVEKEAYMNKAEEQCRGSKMKSENCTSEKLREMVDQMDRVEPK